MLLFDYISKLNTAILFSKFLKGQEKGLLSEAIYRDICHKISSSVDEVSTSLEEDELKILFSIYFYGERGVKNVSYPQRASLLQSFLVYERVDGEDSYLLPFEDLVSSVSSFFSNYYSCDLNGFDNKHYPSWMVDVAMLIGELWQKPLVKKQDGDLPKLFYSKYLPQLALGRMLIDSGASNRRIYILVEHLFKHLIDLGVLTLDGDSYLVTSAQRALFLKSPDDLLNALSIKLFSDGGFDPVFIKSLLNSTSIRVDFSLFASEGCSDYTILAWLGFATVKKVESSLYIKQSSSAIGEFYPAGHILPDFTVVLPREIDPSALLEFLLLGRIDSFDMVYRGVLDRDRVIDSLSKGVSLTQVVEILKRWHAVPSIIHSVSEWAGLFFRAFQDGDFIAIKPGLAEQLMQIPQLKDSLHDISEYKFFYISPGKKESLLREMEGMGFDLRFPKGAYEEIETGSIKICEKRGDSGSVNYSPEMDRVTAGTIKTGIYGGAQKKLSLGDLNRLVRYAMIMDSKLLVTFEDESGLESSVTITPTNVVIAGREFYVEGTTEAGVLSKIMFEDIISIGVASNES